MDAHEKLETITNEIDRQFARWGLRITGGTVKENGLDLTATCTDSTITTQQKLVNAVLKKHNVKQIELTFVPS